MSLDDAWTILSTGKRGTGKTTRLGTVAWELMRRRPGRCLLALDVGSADGPDWPAGALRGQCVPYVCRTVAGAQRGLAAGQRVVIVRPGRLDDENPEAPTRAIAGQLAELAAAHPREVLVCLAEGHMAARNVKNGMAPGLANAVHRARHVGVRVLVDTQFVADLHTSLRKDCRWYVHFTSNGYDLKAYIDAGRDQNDYEPDEVRAAIRDLGERHRRGERGWYVLLDGMDSSLKAQR